ncbi:MULTISPECIES: hypothetical protein [unclassified Microbacterium]|uniref:hypothetical protein n=1 Tax=unclassified Microbacterium TaxID=2609290 RepID=UPI00214B94CD|nr:MULTISPECIES: hypothetical protein [unclassified Microbacterium]MCR2785539.1 hypothetical protein [Microbacterium sp. zg.B96]MDL5350337.1 hypothetical protein [Microbacterium sp. zg-YB36]WIM17473.1 hypothetical protein QNO11_07530 [Microbacterium sp. zg-B96]
MNLTADPTVYEAWMLGAQWVGALAALGSVVVAVVFGVITLGNNRRSKDTQERATLIAAFESPQQSQGVLPDRRSGDRVDFTVRSAGGERWLLLNEGPGTAFSVRIDGLTALDNDRLQPVTAGQGTIAPGDAREFGLVSRYTRSGPANIRVTYRLDPEGQELQRVLVVPAP